MTNVYEIQSKFVKKLNKDYSNTLICYMSNNHVETDDDNKIYNKLKELSTRDKIPLNVDKDNENRIFIYFQVPNSSKKVNEQLTTINEDSLIKVKFSISQNDEYFNFIVDNLTLIKQGTKKNNVGLFDL